MTWLEAPKAWMEASEVKLGTYEAIVEAPEACLVGPGA